MRKTAHQYIRDLEIRVASLEKQAYINNLGQIIKTSNKSDKVEKATIETAFVGFAQGLENTKDIVPKSFSKVIKGLGINSPEQILYLYNNMDRLIDTKNPLIKDMKEKVDRERSFKSRMRLIDEMVANYDPRDPLGFYEWWNQGQADLEEAGKYIDKNNLAQFFLYAFSVVVLVFGVPLLVGKLCWLWSV